MQTQIWAHRGSSHIFVENSMAAFQQAISDGADGVELDVQRTKDGQLVVIHDEHLKRLTGADRFVWATTWEELRKLTLKETSERIPLLEEVLALFKLTDLVVNIELKNSRYFYPGMEQEVVDLVTDFKMKDQVLYSSFNHASMAKMVEMVGGDQCAVLTADIQVKPWKYLDEIGAKTYHPMINSLLQANLISTCQDKGLKVNVWTADESAHIYGALLLGVDAIITNEPARAIELREQFQSDGGQKAMEAVKTLGFSFPE